MVGSDGHAPGARAVIVGFQVGFWVPLIVCTYLALVPEPPEHPLFSLSDIILHAGAFVYLSLAGVLAQSGKGSISGGVYVRTFVFMLVYGVLLEFIQSFIPERSAEMKDLVVDLAGIGIGLGIARFVARPVHELATRLSAFLFQA